MGKPASANNCRAASTSKRCSLVSLMAVSKKKPVAFVSTFWLEIVVTRDLTSLSDTLHRLLPGSKITVDTMAAMKPRTGDGPLEATKEGRGIVMRVPLEGGGRLVVELTPDEAAALGEELKNVTSS